MPVPVLFADASGLGALGINLPALIFELINFGILYWILKRYAYGPIVTILERRRKHIEDSLKAAEAAQAERAAILQEHQEMIAKAKTRAAEIVSEARGDGETKKAAIITEAEKTAEHIVEQAKRETERQLKAAHDQLAGEARQLVVAATARLIDERLDAERDAKLVERALETAGGRRG
ncbi:MAG TPA: F0F1 ATP synthase subunit B [Candidatus Saccharimonadales bacterium]|nr:F0F1 ATP synthase subunit B [Candidatus Saccharimonadales bacterium]